jgi:hypothetical protein
LSSFFKSPLGVEENDFGRQFQVLEAWAAGLPGKGSDHRKGPEATDAGKANHQGAAAPKANHRGTETQRSRPRK